MNTTTISNNPTFSMQPWDDQAHSALDLVVLNLATALFCCYNCFSSAAVLLDTFYSAESQIQTFLNSRAFFGLRLAQF